MFLSIVISLEILISRQLLTGRGRRQKGERRRRKRGGVGPAVAKGKGERGPRGTGRDEEEIGGEEGNGEVEGKGERGLRREKEQTKDEVYDKKEKGGAGKERDKAWLMRARKPTGLSGAESERRRDPDGGREGGTGQAGRAAAKGQRIRGI